MFWLRQPVRWYQFPKAATKSEAPKKTAAITFEYDGEDAEALRRFWLKHRPLDTPFFDMCIVSINVPLTSMIVTRPALIKIEGIEVNGGVHEFWNNEELIEGHEWRRGEPSIFLTETGLPFSCLTEWEVKWIRTDNYVDYGEVMVKANRSHIRELSKLYQCKKQCVILPPLEVLLRYMELKLYSIFFTRGFMVIFKYKNELMVDLVGSIIEMKSANRFFSSLIRQSGYRVVRVHCQSDSVKLLEKEYKTTRCHAHGYNCYPPTLKPEDCLVV
jgi:hypothetical protein